MFNLFFRKKHQVKREGEIEPQDILLDKWAEEKNNNFINRKMDLLLSERVLKGIIVVFLAIIFIFGIKIYQLQIKDHSKYLALAQQNEFTYRSIKSERGIIYDRDHKQLVYNIPRIDLVCLKSKLSNQELNSISQITHQKLSQIKSLIKNDSSAELRFEKLNHKSVIQAEIERDEIPDCKIKKDFMRNYLEPDVFSHLIGYYRNSRQLSGLELYYNDELKERPGQMVVERDALGHPKLEKVNSLPQTGHSLILSIDSGLQNKLFNSLKERLNKYGAKSGSAVAMNPENGAVLALVSLPGFNSNGMSQGWSSSSWNKVIANTYKPFWNRAIDGCYPSGSTIKPFLASAALEEGVISPSTKINCPLKVCVPNLYSGKEKCFSDWKYHGLSGVRRAIAESVNTFFYIIGGGYKGFQGLGIDRIDKYLDLFGFGKKTGIDLPLENACLLPNPKWKEAKIGRSWYIGDTYNLSIGQGYFQTSPLQEAVAYSSIANGGILYKPEILKSIIDTQGNVIQEVKPKIIRKDFISPNNLEVVREGMREVVASPNGTAHLLNDLPIAVAAKTGTAQIPKKDYYDNWITVFAPYNHPKIVISIVAENIPGHHFPVAWVAHDALEWYFENKLTQSPHS